MPQKVLVVGIVKLFFRLSKFEYLEGYASRNVMNLDTKVCGYCE